MKTLLRFLSRRKSIRKFPQIALIVGALYGTLELYGYAYTARIMYDVIRPNNQ